MPPKQSYAAWKVCLTLLHAFAVGSTGLRLWDRFRTRKLWWDDYVALLPMVCDAFYAVLFFFRFRSKFLTPEERHEISQWTVANSFLYYTIIWASRISLSLSMTRVVAPGRVRSQLFALTSSFIGAYIISFILSVTTCSAGAIDRSKLQFDIRRCRKGPDSAGFYLGGVIATIFDFVADAALVICPLVLFWRVNLPEVERRMVLAAFSASILTALATAVFCIFWQVYSSFAQYLGRISGLDENEQTKLILACPQTTISLIVCNTLVVSMYFYRRFRPRDATRASPAISTFSDTSQCTHFSVSERRKSHGEQRNNRPYATAPSRLVQSPPDGVSYDLPERFTAISECATSQPCGDDKSEYPETACSVCAENFDGMPSWLARGGEHLSMTSTFESAAKRAEEKNAKKARNAQIRGHGVKISPRERRDEADRHR